MFEKIASLYFIIVFFSFAQVKKEKVYQFSGLILSKGSEEIIPYARVLTKKNRRIAIANREGFYSIPVTAKDTLYFIALGHKPVRLSIEEYLKTYVKDTSRTYIYAIHYLPEDNIVLPTVTIFPYKTPEELKTAILNVPMRNTDPLRVAHANVNPAIIDYLVENLPVDVKERQQIALETYRQTFHNRGVWPTVPFLDPIALFYMVNQLAKQTKKRKEKNYNYWPEK